ncbi:MAG TPA: ferritin family protein [Geopsychrobacteraceae bacterium]|nr:ferritin family protein [Geopsychrobacteraceae bacterium]
MNRERQLAVRKMIQVELDAMNYYQLATRYMKDQGAIDHFNQLAKEEQEHARNFYDIYPGDDLPPFAEMVQNHPKQNSLVQSIDGELMARLDERQALQLAIRLEQEVEGSLRRMVMEAGDPAVKAVLEKNAESTLNHLRVIKEDFQRLYGDLSG